MTDQTPIRARTSDLIVEQVDGETLIFDQRSDTAHCLSASAAAVWRACDGRTSHTQLIDLVAGLGEDEPELVVDRALSELAERDLLQVGVSRRAALTRMATIGAAVLSVPLVLSVKAPTAEAGQSSLIGGSCTSPADCKVGTCGTSSPNLNKCCYPSGAAVATCTVKSGNSGTNSTCCSGTCNVSKLQCS